MFGFDVAESSQIRRVRALVGLGHEVHSFTMRRDNMNRDFQPDWPNTHLFHTQNENLLRRAVLVAASIVKLVPHRARLRAADIILARNLDMLVIACAARTLAGASHVPIVYECLDINGALCRDTTGGRAMRAAERFLLRRSQMLVVSSPGFIRNYFARVQNYDGPWALLENKLSSSGAFPQRPVTQTRAPGTPMRLGWVGTIRCAPSLQLLAATADAMGPALEVHVHGVVHRHALADFDAVIQARPNMFYHGPYSYPQDIAALYQGCDLVWAQDLWQRGNNSDWLLPNRIYEASWAGCPCVALADTETGRRILQDNLGWVIDTADPACLTALLSSLTPCEVAQRAQDLLDRQDSRFVQSPQEIDDVIQKVCAA